jgi:hypothetical protein
MISASRFMAWDVASHVGTNVSLRQACRALARRRATLAAASSLIPIPGVDLATDLFLLTRVIGQINEHYGLSEAQIGMLSSQRQAMLFRLLSNAGGTLALRLTTPNLIARVVRLIGFRLTAMEAVRLVPIAGQIVAAGIGYWSFNTVTSRHIAHCEKVAAEVAGRAEMLP